MMITTWQIILAIIIVGLSIIMPIFYFYQNKQDSQKKIESLEYDQIKDYVNKINEESKKNK
jgi:uncharacterized membrane-anchored protein YhcB (DUF1043 family)